ncbi:hypothetical protein CDD81_1 [Ophiocordyceps australis]|uniref:RRM domain-containing protein n=1 Tax=Ophiocordyceps australis TaxID=1399860 RepID=A0A2C5YHV6_9HYPO|nr:hypothetical protein CDD81_1 [Ophiocordyceps australis]
MNKIRAIQALNQKEIEQGISPNASWHTDYRDTAFVYFGGLPYDLSEGDVITIFSQFGEPVFLKLVRDAETGKSKGFGWLKYEDQRSTDLAVDNLGGAHIGGRLISVDHARYKARDDEDPAEYAVSWQDMRRRQGLAVSDDEASDADGHVPRPLLPEERQLADLMQNHDDDDPMKMYLIEEKKKEVEEARERAENKDRKRKHRHHGSSKHRRDEDETRSRRHQDDDSADHSRHSRHHEHRHKRHGRDTAISRHTERSPSRTKQRPSHDSDADQRSKRPRRDHSRDDWSQRRRDDATEPSYRSRRHDSEDLERDSRRSRTPVKSERQQDDADNHYHDSCRRRHRLQDSRRHDFSDASMHKRGDPRTDRPTRHRSRSNSR